MGWFEIYSRKPWTFEVAVNRVVSQTLAVKRVLITMAESGDYFFFAISPNQSVTAFRSEIGQENLAGLTTNLGQIQGSTTTDAQYERALARFRRHPDPPGQVLNWVCRDNVDYLDLTQDRLEMNPAR